MLPTGISQRSSSLQDECPQTLVGSVTNSLGCRIAETGHWRDFNEGRHCPQTDVSADNMLQDARMTGSTGRTAALGRHDQWQVWAVREDGPWL